MKRSSDQKTFREIRYEQKKVQILESAARIFSQKGFEKASMEDIANELLMTKGSLYYYIKSKEDMLFQCHMMGVKMANEVLDNVLKSDLPPEERLYNAIVGHIKVVTQEFVCGTLRQQELLLPRHMKEKIIAERDKFEKKFFRIFKEGVKAGVFDNRDIKMKAYSVLGAINWIPRWYSSSGKLSSEEIATAMADFLLKGMVKP